MVRASGGRAQGYVIYQVTRGANIIAVERTSGLVTIFAPGNALITATKTDSNGRALATATLEIVITTDESVPTTEASRPKHARPSHDQPVYDHTSHGQTSHDQPPHDQPVYGQTSHDQTAHGQTLHDQPASPPLSSAPTSSPEPQPPTQPVVTTSVQPVTTSAQPAAESVQSVTALTKHTNPVNASWTIGIAAAVVVAAASLFNAFRKRF